MNFWKYSNPLWEPHFEDISPFWAKVYFATGIGPVRRLAASVIFRIVSNREK